MTPRARWRIPGIPVAACVAAAMMLTAAACGGTPEPQSGEGRSNVAELIKQDVTVGGGNEAATGRRVKVH
jgi:hypothetical protein